MLWAVIMAGGSGTRFWPESRRKKPKQFLSIFGKRTLLEETARRLTPLIPKSRILVITSKDHAGKVCKILNLPKSRVIGEPVSRNTAPCAALAAAVILQKDPNAVIALLSSDHRIGNELRFRKALAAAASAASEIRFPILFGIKPAFAHSGYGYLEMGPVVKKQNGFVIHRLRAFHEKPSQILAERYVRSGRYFWNSGIFVWRADALLEATKKFLPKVYRLVQRIVDPHPPLSQVPQTESVGARLIAPLLKKYFPQMPTISIDYGLMEKLPGKILAIPANIDWNDLGSWHSFAELWPKDKDQNVVLGHCLLVESSGNVVKSHRKLIALLGVENHIVIDTEDALLVCPRHKTESIRKIIKALKKKKLHKHL